MLTSLISNFATELALNAGEKAACKFGAKIVTSVASTAIAYSVVNELNKKDKPADQMTEQEKFNKLLRNSAITNSIVLAGTGLNYGLGHLIDAQDSSAAFATDLSSDSFNTINNTFNPMNYII